MPLCTYRYSPSIGWEPVPSTSFFWFDHWAEEKQYRVGITFNAQGFRGPECEIPKPPGTYRIVFIGDSFTEGLQVAYDELYSARLVESLTAMDVPHAKQVEAVNLGVSGQGPAKHLITLIEKGLEFEPDLVIEQLCGNDIEDDQETRTCGISEDGLVEIRAERPAWLKRRFLAVKFALKHHSQLYLFLSYTWAHRRAQDEQDLSSVIANRSIRAGELRLRRNSPRARSLAYISEISRVAAENGADFIMFSFSDLFKENLMPLLVEDGIHGFDLSSDLKESESRGKPVSYSTDPHWNARGHEIVSEKIIEYLLNNGIISRDDSVSWSYNHSNTS